MATLPPEIWLHVAGFMSVVDLWDMLDVNKTFFQLAMDKRYYDVMFTSFDERRQLRYLRRLRDPGVAQHVRSLRVFAEFSDEFNDECRARYNPNLLQSLATPREFWNLQAALDTIDNSFNEVLQAMAETVAYLTNITYFLIYWRQISPSVEHLRPFLTTTWRAIGPSVQELDLVASLNYMPGLISTTMMGRFKELRKLEVECYSREPSETQPEEVPGTSSIATILAPFVNKVAPTLTCLSLRAYTPEFEISSLLNQLEHIPALERLRLMVWQCESHVLEYPIHLSRFLQSHAATLRCFDWAGSLPSKEFRSKDGRSNEELMLDFLSGSRLDKAFSDLRKLELPVPGSDMGFRLLIQCIELSASTLTRLRLWGCFLTYDKVDMIVSLSDLCSRAHLKKLALWVEVLSPELCFLLARTCPRLETLNITTSYVAAANERGQAVPESAEEALANAQKFANRMREHDFRDWSLTDIHIQQKPARNDPLYAKVMLLFGECIPSVQRFNGSHTKPWCIQDVPDDKLRL